MSNPSYALAVKATACETLVNRRSLNLYRNKEVIDRRLRPRYYHMESYFKRPKSNPVRPLECNWYYCAVYSQVQRCICATLQLNGDVEQLWLMANMTSSIKPEVYNVSLRRQRRTELRP